MTSKTNIKLASFDGGGIHGLSQLKIVDHIMHRLSRDDEPNESNGRSLPYEHFDLIGGSGTGGLIAILLTKLRMSAQEASEELWNIMEHVYKPANLSASQRTEALKRCMERAMQRKGLPIDLRLATNKREGCASFVVVSPRINAKSTICLRTYPIRRQPASSITVVEAVLATCATEPAFAPVSIGSGYNTREYMAARGAANPVYEVITEACLLFGGDASVASLLSLGTGHPGIISLPQDGNEVVLHEIMRDLMHDSEQTAQEIEERIGRVGIYSRFSVHQGMRNKHIVQLDDPRWIIAQTEDYLSHHQTGGRLNLLVQNFGVGRGAITLGQLKHAGGSRTPGNIATTDQKAMEITNEEIITKLRPKDLQCEPQVEMCLEGTRLDILQEVRSWSEDLDAPNILWINGYPGVGKSAIASTIVEQLRSSNRLGSSFFFQRERASAMTSNALWRTVAHDLSQRYSSIRRCLITALNANESLLTTPNVYGLFRELIYEPLMKSDEIPIEKLPVIVLDALDECGGIDGRRSDHRKKLMRTLKSWSSLPRRFKLIVTSRQESDIEQLFSTVFHHPIEILAGENVNSFSSSDIRTFLVHELRQLVARDPSLPLGWPGERPVSWLVDHARGLFIWIKTVIKLLENGEPGQILKQVYRNGASSMADLYAWILHESFPEPSENGIQNFRAILGVIIFTKEPLDVASLANFLSIDESTLEQICNSLKAVLDCEITIRIRHQSFVDFLLDPENCPSLFLINNERESRNLILCCLSTMRRHLRFNICHLDSSYVRNRDVPYLARRVKECVPPYLSYASRYWASHLGEAASDGGVNDSLQYFMDRQFLWWLETMSLIEQIDMGSSMLQSLVSWLRKANQDESLARDMQKFVTTFESIISQSAPHIYISALPFAPRRSGVSNRYLEYYPQTLVVRHGGYNSWPAVQNVCIGHKDAVLSVDFSPDGRRIVSGSRDCTIRVWDVETGKVVLGPLQSHNDAILCVSFSSDGRRIVSGAWDCTIRVWDAERGETILGPLKGHTDAILSVKFSPDGRRIVSGSEDRTIRIWDTETGETVLDPLKGHKNSVYSVSFSPDGRKIASGSGDHTIRVWDAETGETVLAPLKFHSVSFSPDERRIFSGFEKRTIRPWDVKTTSNVLGPFEGHSNSVFSVSFSPDGRWLASGSDDRTIQLWDAETGEAVLGPLQGHDRSVRSISFSPDGRRIASGSRDFTIRIWDVETGEMVAGPLQSHNNAVLSVAFSADGRKVVSGSEDRTVRIWDAETSSTIRSLFEGHGDSVVSVSFSPDGSRFVSSSSDHTIRIWDAETGEAILDPLQGHSSRVQSVSFSPDGTRIVSGSWDHTIRIWDAETGGTVLGPLRGHSNSVCSVSFSPDGRRLVSGSDDHTVLIWDAETGDIVLNPLRGHTHPVFSVSFSPDGRKIISGSLDHTIRIWDAETGETVLNLLSGKGYPVLSVSFSPDGRRIAFGSDGHTVQVWDTETDKAALRPLQGHSDWIQSVSFSPDGTRIVSGSSDHTIRVWDAETGETILAPLKGHNGMVSSVSFSPDGRRIVSGSGDHTIRLWDSSPNESLTNPYAIFRETAETKDGWVLGPSAQLLFWVPPEIRPRLCPLSNSLVIDRQIGWTTLDLDHFVHGREWARCKDRRVT